MRSTMYSVYKTHCKTFSILKELLFINSNVSDYHNPPSWVNFRAVKEYRDDAAKQLRNHVARIVIEQRAKSRIF